MWSNSQADHQKQRSHLFSYVLRESLCFLNCGGQLHSVRCWQHPSVILCCIASTRIALLTHIAIWERFWMVLLTAVFTLLFVCTPLSPPTQFGNKSGLGESIHTAVNIVFFLLPSASFFFEHNSCLICMCRQIVEVCITTGNDDCVSESSVLRKTRY